MGKKSKIVAVILHYWPGRTENVKEIVKALQEGSRPPDKIIVFNNNSKITYPQTNGIIVINSSHNYGGRARYPIALLEPSDYYYFCDDDMKPMSKTLENFEKHAHEDCCLGYLGKKANPKENPYTNGTNYWGNEIRKPKYVDLLVGHGSIFVSFNSLVKMFVTEKMLLGEDYTFGREEDIILSIGSVPMVIPADEDEYLVNLTDPGGYCREDGHNDLRNVMTDKLLGYSV